MRVVASVPAAASEDPPALISSEVDGHVDPVLCPDVVNSCTEILLKSLQLSFQFIEVGSSICHLISVQAVDLAFVILPVG